MLSAQVGGMAGDFGAAVSNLFWIAVTLAFLGAVVYYLDVIREKLARLVERGE